MGLEYYLYSNVHEPVTLYLSPIILLLYRAQVFLSILYSDRHLSAIL
jgi:hypothetical protein